MLFATNLSLNNCWFRQLFQNFKISGQTGNFQDTLWISGHFRTVYKISGISGPCTSLYAGSRPWYWCQRAGI